MGLQLTGLESQASIDSQASSSSFQSSGSSDCSTLNRGPHKCLAILHGQSLHVTTLALSGDVLYAGSNYGEIRAWEHPDMLEQARFGCGGAAVKCLVVVDGEKLISAHQDHKIRVWRRSTSQPQEHRLVASLPSVKDYIANFLPAKNYVQVGGLSHPVPYSCITCIKLYIAAFASEKPLSPTTDKSVSLARRTNNEWSPLFFIR